MKRSCPESPRPAARAPWARAGLLLVLLAAGPAWADKPESVLRLIEGGKSDQARERCDRWAADAPDAEEPLREACARAFWLEAEAKGDVAAWRAFRARWDQSTYGPRARSAEGAAALAAAPPQEREANLLLLADRYAGTASEAPLRERAAAAAVRDARDGDEARAVALRYPKEPSLGELVARFPTAFLQLRVEGRRVELKVDPPVKLSGPLEPVVRWVARDGAGEPRPWDEVMREALVAWGAPAQLVAGLPKGTDDSPALPFCPTPTRSAAPAVQVEVGGGVVTVPVAADEGCGEGAWPGFLVVSNGRAVGLSLRPGHLVNLAEGAAPGAERSVRAFLGAPSGEPELSDGLIYQRTPTAWLVMPVSGGAAWASGAGPGRPGLPLGTGLRGAPLPGDWSVVAEEPGQRVKSGALARMPPSMQRWSLPKGEARVLPMHLRAAFGMLAMNAQPARSAAPPLDAGGGWVRNADGSLQRTQPLGADVAGIQSVDEVAIETALGVLAGIGVKRGRVQPADGWRVDIDNDRVPELVLRAAIDGQGVVIVVDPTEGTEAVTVEKARVFVFDEPTAKAQNMKLDLPFAFRKGEFVYLAWGAQQPAPGGKVDRHVVSVRSDGVGFVVDRFVMP